MKYTTFSDLTVRQYQSLYEIQTSDRTDIDKARDSVAVLTGLTSRQVEDELPIKDFLKASRELSVIFGVLPKTKPQKYIKVNGKLFGIEYNPRELVSGQFIEIQGWLAEKKMVENMHKILASLIYPVKKYGPVTFRGKNDSSKHPENAEGILDCNFLVVHAACVFFCQLWTNSIKALLAFLEKDLRGTMKKEEAEILTEILRLGSDGLTTQKKYQISRG